MSDFTKDWTKVTAAHLKLPWSGKRDGTNFRCFLCGHSFQVGDEFRLLLTPEDGSLLTCDRHGDEKQIAQAWAALRADWKRESQGRFWKFVQWAYNEGQQDGENLSARRA
jgi:hypothetical protein